jgi:polar amino acid transport system permease protein
MIKFFNNKVISLFISVLFVVGLFLYLGFASVDSLNFGPYLSDFGGLLWRGFLNTILVSMIALFFSLVIGFLLYQISQTKVQIAKDLVFLFSEIVYGTPLLVMIILMVFFIGPALSIEDWPTLGIAGIILYMAPYMKNVFVSSFSTISKDQYMAMDLFGFNSFQRYRYLIFPQVIRALMPPLMNNFSLIIKGSALLSIIGYSELFSIVSVVQSRTFLFVEGYLLLWALYLCITIPLSQFSSWLERKFRT